MKDRKGVIEGGILKGETKEFNPGNADVGKWILETLKSKPDFVGQVDPANGEECTYGKMAENSVRCALWLRKRGLKPGDVVCTRTYNKLSTYIPILATLYNRAVHNVWSYGPYPELARYMIKALKPKFIFVEEGEVEMILKAAKEENFETRVVVFTEIQGMDSLKDILKEANSSEVDKFCCTESKNLDDKCLLSLTSGTTGDVSKIVVHSYKSIMLALQLYVSENEPREVKMNYLPLAWLTALMRFLADLLAFVKRVVANEMSYDLQESFRYIEKYQVTSVCFGLGMIHRLYKSVEEIKYDTSSLKLLIIKGVKLKPDILKFLMKVVKSGQLKQIYGSTESAHPVSEGIMNDINLNSFGYICPNTQMKVIDTQAGAILGPNEKGELCIKSPYVLSYFLGDEESTNAAFDSKGTGFFHTGDLGYFDESGLGYTLGRISNLLTPNGKIIPTWDVERVLSLNCEVLDVVVLTISTISDKTEIFAFVTLMNECKVTEEELCEMTNRLGSINIPITVKIIDSLPLTSTGKVKIKELKKIAENIKSNN